MKKLSILLPMALMVCGVSANAAIIACGSTVISYATWSAAFAGAGNGCLIGDKLFTNFSVGSIPNDTSIQFGQNGNSYTINFINTPGGGFNTSFSESFDIAIDFTQAPANVGTWRIVRVAAGLQDSSGSSVASLVKTISGGATGVASASTNGAGVTTQVVLNGISASSLHVVDDFTLTSGNITNISDTFLQADVSIPEPSTLFLLGGALLGFSLVRRSRLI